MEPSVGFAATYNDNITLTAAPHPTVWGLKLSPAVLFSGETETLKVSGGARFDFVRYYGEEGLNHNDYYFTSRSSYKTERDLLGLNLAANSDPTLVSELPRRVWLSPTVSEPADANPTWSRSLTETTSLTAGCSYTGVNYGNTRDQPDRLQRSSRDGRSTNRSVENIASVTAHYDRYETNHDSFGPIPAAFKRDSIIISRDAAWHARTAAQDAEHHFVPGARLRRRSIRLLLRQLITLTRSANRLDRLDAHAGLENRWETTTLGGRLSREIYPTGNGQLVQTIACSLPDAAVSPTVTGYVTASAYQTEYIGGTVTGSNSNYYDRTQSELAQPKRPSTATAG
jgi:hypothetical protein